RELDEQIFSFGRRRRKKGGRKEMKSTILNCVLVLMVGLVFVSPTYAQGMNKDAPQRVQVGAGAKQELKGVIIKRDADSFLMRDQSGAEATIKLTDSTKVEEKKSNPFRSAKKYPVTELMRGLNVEVEGRGDDSGALVAEKIKFTNNSLMVA